MTAEREKMLRVKTMILFANGDIAAFDESNSQIGGLQQKTATQLWAEHATRLGYDVEGCECRMQAPGGPGMQVVLDMVDGQWKESVIV